MQLIKQIIKDLKGIAESYEAGRESCSLSWARLAYGHASLNAVGTEQHSELRKEFNDIMNSRKTPNGILENIVYQVGHAIGWVNP